MDETYDLSRFNLDGYTLASQEKAASSRGGLMSYIYNCFTFEILHQPNQLDNWEDQIVEIYSET